MVVRSPGFEHQLLTDLNKARCHGFCGIVGVGLVEEQLVLVVRLNVKAVLSGLGRFKPAIKVVHRFVVLRCPKRLQCCGQGLCRWIACRVAVSPIRLDIGVRRVHKRISNSRLARLRLVYGCGPLVSRLTVELSVGGSRRVHFTRDAVDGDSRAGQALEPPTIDDQGLTAQPVALRIANSVNFRVNSNAPTIRAGKVAMF